MNWNYFFEYDETSPSFLRWKNTRCPRLKSGDVAGSYSAPLNKYTVKFNKRTYFVHRVIWFLFHGEIPEDIIVDHRDGEGTNNNILNLRAVENVLNIRNRKKFSNNKSGTTGVSFRQSNTGGRWIASWHSLDGKHHQKSFSISKYGIEEAKQMAIDFREYIMSDLNEQGAGFTERHGK